MNGWMMTSKAMLDRNPAIDRRTDPPRSRRVSICRCGSHAQLIFSAVRRAADAMKRGGHAHDSRAAAVSRRDFVRSAGGLMIGLQHGRLPALDTRVPRPPRRRHLRLHVPVGPPLAKMDSWLRIALDGTVTVCTGKVEIGMGVNVALKQIVAEELASPSIASRWRWVTRRRRPIRAASARATPSPPAARRSGTSRRLPAGACCNWPRASSRRRSRSCSTERHRSLDHRTRPRPFALRRSRGDANALNEELKVTGAGFTLNVEGSGKPKRSATTRSSGSPFRGPISPTKCSARSNTLATSAYRTCCTAASFVPPASAPSSSALTTKRGKHRGLRADGRQGQLRRGRRGDRMGRDQGGAVR